MQYPNGILVEVDGWVYRVSGSTLLPLVSWKAAQSWNQPIIVGQPDLLEGFEVATSKLGFRGTTVLESFTTGKKYFVDGAYKRLINDPDAWEALGFNDYENYLVSDEELEFHPVGEPIG